MDLSFSKQSDRRSDGVRAPRRCSSEGRRKRRRGRGVRGEKMRKRRAGARKHRTKSERLGRGHLRVLYWNCSSVSLRRTVVEKVAYSADI